MSLELDRSAKLFDRPSWLPITADEATPTSRQQALSTAGGTNRLLGRWKARHQSSHGACYRRRRAPIAYVPSELRVGAFLADIATIAPMVDPRDVLRRINFDRSITAPSYIEINLMRFCSVIGRRRLPTTTVCTKTRMNIQFASGFGIDSTTCRSTLLKCTNWFSFIWTTR